MSPQAVRLLVRDRRNKQWFRLSNDIWLMEVSKYSKLIYAYLCRCAEDAPTCNPSFPDIRRKTGCSHGVIVKALQELEKAGLIKRSPEPGTSTTYEVFDPIVERTQSTGDCPPPSHGLTAPQSPADLPTQSPADRKEDLVLKNTEVKKTFPPISPIERSFETFYEAYPRKVGREKARQAWAKLSPSPLEISVIMEAVASQQVIGNTLNPTNGKVFIPHASTWLNGSRWGDEIVEAPKTGRAQIPAKNFEGVAAGAIQL